jgi:hypothetical protein
MNTYPELEALIKLRDRLVRERLQVLHQLAAASPTSPLPDETLRSLAVIQTAAVGVDAEIATHMPRLGHGAEE